MFIALKNWTMDVYQNGEVSCQRGRQNSPRCCKDGQQKRGKLSSVLHAMRSPIPRTKSHNNSRMGHSLVSHVIFLQCIAPSRVQGRLSSPRVVAVSKCHPADKVLEAYEQGVRDFGENYVQELFSKSSLLAKSGAAADIRWHYIGNLQRRKAKRLISKCASQSERRCNVYCILIFCGFLL